MPTDHDWFGRKRNPHGGVCREDSGQLAGNLRTDTLLQTPDFLPWPGLASEGSILPRFFDSGFRHGIFAVGGSQQGCGGIHR